jgi:hypothetical protein
MKYSVAVPSSGLMFVQSFVKISQRVEKEGCIMGHTNSITVSKAYIVSTTCEVLASFRSFFKFFGATSWFHNNKFSLCRLLATRKTPCQEEWDLTLRFIALGHWLHYA